MDALVRPSFLRKFTTCCKAGHICTRAKSELEAAVLATLARLSRLQTKVIDPRVLACQRGQSCQHHLWALLAMKAVQQHPRRAH